VSTTPPVVALIGAGGIARPHLAGWTALGARVRLFSHDGADELAAGVRGVTVVDELPQALEGADLVDVCAPTDTHAAIVWTAIGAGVDVVCEKPLARTADDAQALVDAADAAGVKLVPGHVVRWFPAYEALQAQIAAGALGELAVLRFSRAGARPDRGWFHDVERSGGIVLDQMIHDIDQALCLAGDVVEVSGQQSRPGPDGVITAQAVLVHASGALSYVTGTWGPVGTTFRTTFEVAGTDGLLQHDSTAFPEVRLDARDAGAATGLLPPVVGTSPYQRVLEDALAWFGGGPAPRLSPADGVAAIRVAEAVVAAIASGEAVAVPAATTTKGASA
jgi:predicted dehydrogenase